MGDKQPAGLKRQLGLFQATAINVTMVVGAGVFVTIPSMLGVLPGPYALLGWIAAGGLMLVDCLVWSELGAAFPGSGGSYIYLLECYGRNRWGRFMAFLFIWQFLISGPLEIASGLIAADLLGQGLLSEKAEEFNKRYKVEYVLEWKAFSDETQKTSVTVSPTRLTCVAVGAFCIFLLYRRVTSLGRMAVIFWIGILAAIAWILIEGILHFDSSVAFDLSGEESQLRQSPLLSLGQAMMLAMYSYIGYYNICYMGDEVHEPGRNIPRSILLSSLLVITLFVGLHLAMVGSYSWKDAAGKDNFNLPAAFMNKIHGAHWAGIVVTFLIFGSIFASAFSGLLGYSRIPYGAARAGHFFSTVGKIHPEHEIPHVSLLLVGGLTLAWTLFDFGSVLNAIITTRLLIQFVGQIVGLILLRRSRPEGPWPFRMWLYPIPCGVALVGWLYIYATSGPFFIVVSFATLVAGATAFFIWSAAVKSWPFAINPEA